MRSEGLLTRFFSSEINVSKERKNERTFESSRFEIVDFQIRNGLNCRGTPAPTPSDPRGSEIFHLSRSSIFKKGMGGNLRTDPFRPPGVGNFRPEKLRPPGIGRREASEPPPLKFS